MDERIRLAIGSRVLGEAVDPSLDRFMDLVGHARRLRPPLSWDDLSRLAEDEHGLDLTAEELERIHAIWFRA